MSKSQLPGFMIVLILSLLYIKFNNVMIKFVLTISTLLGMLTLSLAKFLSMLLKYFTVFNLSVDSSTNILEPNDPHNSDLLVYQYDCSKQHNLCQFTLSRVQFCIQAPSPFENTRASCCFFRR